MIDVSPIHRRLLRLAQFLCLLERRRRNKEDSRMKFSERKTSKFSLKFVDLVGEFYLIGAITLQTFFCLYERVLRMELFGSSLKNKRNYFLLDYIFDLKKAFKTSKN